MPLICSAGAQNAGGAVFTGNVTHPATPVVLGGKMCLVGDTSTCPGHDTPQPTTITTGSATVFVNGIAVAVIGSQTSCGHAMVSAGTNTFVSA